jgi:nucleoside-diphosphate-sugar epimerase
MIQNKKILITGGAGFIASHIIEALFESNEIIIYDNFIRNAFNYTNFQKHPNIQVIRGDVLDKLKIEESLKGCDTCIHAAAIAGIYSVGNSLSNTIKVNLIGAFNALEASIKNGVQQFIDFSTSEVYGPFVYLGKESDRTTQGPISEKRWIYAVSKLASEHLSHAYGNDYSLNVSTVRPFNVYGPRQVGEGAIQQMVSQAIRNEEITIYNDGTQIRSWCYVTDFAEAICRILTNKNANGEVFNIGNPKASCTILGLAQDIIRLTKSKSRIGFKPHPGPEVEIRIPSIEKAETLLEFYPKVGLEEGLTHTIKWFKNNVSK